MADNIMTFRMIVKEIAAMHDVHATFMPKPLEGVQGSGMHLHLSLFKGEDNAFFDANDPYHLSATAKSFMAGLLFHAAEITAITNQTVNSYKRLVPGFEAPVHISWARNNRSGLIRVPIPKRGNPMATRIEYRSPDAACNPYLAFSVLLAAGLKGIGAKLDKLLAGFLRPAHGSPGDTTRIVDLLFHLPLRYQDRTRVTPLAQLQLGLGVVGVLGTAAHRVADVDPGGPGGEVVADQLIEPAGNGESGSLFIIRTVFRFQKIFGFPPCLFTGLINAFPIKTFKP